jgi:hypothetical protein
MAKRRLLFVPITKVDAETRTVYGRAVEETPDKSGEIFDYATSKPHFDAWSEEVSKATDGKSLGNVRAMHGSVAAGKLIAYQPDDAAKAIDIGAKIVDDAEWEKVEQGVYTGFSIGGSYEKRWKDPNDATLTRYTAKPVEISIVDNPCVPSARFTMVKADGVEEEREFAPAPTTLDGLVRKGLWSVSRLADLLSSVQYLAQDVAWEAEYEGDGSGVPAQLRDWLTQGVTILTDMVSEEGAEAVASVPAPAATPAVETLALAASGEVAKAAGAESVEPPAPTEPTPVEKAATVDLLKRLDEQSAELQKAIGQMAELKQQLEVLKAQPAPAKGVVRAVEKAADTPGPTEPAEPQPDPNNPLAVAKAVFARGGTPLLFPR